MLGRLHLPIASLSILNMIRVIVLLFFFLLATSHVSSNTTDGGSGSSQAQCIEKERQALLTFKQGLVDTDNILSSWTSSRRDCCTWRGIRCDNLTHHIIVLDLRPQLKYIYTVYGSYYIAPQSQPIGVEICPSLAELQHLKYLDLSYNNFTKIPKFIASLENLEFLNLAYNHFNGIIPSHLGNLSRLQILILGTNGQMIVDNLKWLSTLPSLRTFRLENTDFTKARDWFQSLKKAPSLSSLQLYNCQLPQVDIMSLSHKNTSNSLKNLDIFGSTIHPVTVPWLLNFSSNLVSLTVYWCDINGPIPNSFENMKFLARLNLEGNGFEGRLPKSLTSLCNLQELELSGNNFHNMTPRDILGSLSGCANNSLEVLCLSSSHLEGPLPDLSMFSYLRYLDVSRNKLKGTSLEGIGELYHLEYLDLSYNSLTGIVSEVQFQKLFKLKVLELSFSSLTLKFNSTWVPPFQLDYLWLRSCKLGPQFPSWLKSQVNITSLDISNSGIQDNIPIWIRNFASELIYLNLSSNQLHGPIPPSLLKAQFLYLSNNRFISLRSFLCEPIHGATKVLDLSNNLLFGSLPDCWWNLKSLIVLNLDNNNLSGVIPSSIGLLYGIQFLQLRQNNFSGTLPLSMKNCTQLQVLDIEENALEGKIPTWIGERLTKLIFLRIKSNKFSGSVPSNICHLCSIQILDLSMNDLSGAIPSCIENFTSMMFERNQVLRRNSSILTTIPYSETYAGQYKINTMIMWKGKYSNFEELLGLLRIIDFSSNKLTGKIPEDVANLVELVQLNLSRNVLSGTIPVEIGKLNKLESLDLSHNKLSSEIPISLANIFSLNCLDLSNNQLSGRIPTSTQLQSFSASTYIGNLGLCGLPLTNPCPEEKSPKGNRQDHSSEGGKEWFDMPWFKMGIGAGFAVGFAGVCGNLLLNTAWRHAYFRFMNNLGDWLYVTIAVKVAKLKRMFSS